MRSCQFSRTKFGPTDLIRLCVFPLLSRFRTFLEDCWIFSSAQWKLSEFFFQYTKSLTNKETSNSSERSTSCNCVSSTTASSKWTATRSHEMRGKILLTRALIRRSNFMRSKFSFSWDRNYFCSWGPICSLMFDSVDQEVDTSIMRSKFLIMIRSHDRFVSCKYDHEIEWFYAQMAKN